MRPVGHTPLPRYRSWRGPALLSQGFRPFFFAGALWAALALPLTLAVLFAGIEPPLLLDPVAYHAHELLFGYLAAVMAGYLLSALPNWTGRLPLQGMPLLLLVLLWAGGRMTVPFGGFLGATVVAPVDLAFLLAMLSVSAREVIAGRNWRNLPMLAALALLLLANGLSHLEAAGMAETGAIGRRLAISVFLLLIARIGGRLIPSFVRNWLQKRGCRRLPPGERRFDHWVLAATALTLAMWIAGGTGASLGVAAALTALLHLLRFLRWQPHRVGSEPFLWSFLFGYLWLIAGFALLALAAASAVPLSAAIHAFTAGAMGAMPLAVMTRMSLSMTGRALGPGGATTAIHLLANLAAVLRIAAVFPDAGYLPIIELAAASWSAAFLLFLGICGGALLSPRPRGTGNPGRPSGHRPAPALSGGTESTG